MYLLFYTGKFIKEIQKTNEPVKKLTRQGFLAYLLSFQCISLFVKFPTY